MRVSLVIALALLIALTACGGRVTDENAGGNLTVDQVTANLTLPTDTGAIYMRIQNSTGSDDAFTGASVSGCEAVELHEMIMQGDIMVMRQVEGNRIPIPAGETVMIERGGLHVMCIGKTGEFAVGESIPVTLEFENAGTIEVMAEVIDPADMPTDMESEN